MFIPAPQTFEYKPPQFQIPRNNPDVSLTNPGD